MSTARLPIVRAWAMMLACSWLASPGFAAAPPQPPGPPRGHAHNDYEHPRPLLDALDHGFGSVEADVFLVEDELLVAHYRALTQPERTLQSLYLEPLRQRVRANGGRVQTNLPGPFYLLIDFKTDGSSTWRRLSQVLNGYREMLTEFRDHQVQPRAVTVILSGSSPREDLGKTEVRLAAIDGRLPDLEANPNPLLVPWISDNWTAHFRWRGDGEIPAAEREKLSSIVSRAHRQGRMVRFWGTPDLPAVWQTLHAAGADLINSDRLAELEQFLHSRSGQTRPRAQREGTATVRAVRGVGASVAAPADAAPTPSTSAGP